MRQLKHLPRIRCYTDPHNTQRYNTPGDYFFIKGGLPYWRFKISEMKIDYEFLVLMHELTEWYLTQKRGISESSISKFDMKGVYEVDLLNADDPGVSKFAPYHAEHMFATKIERMIAKELGVDWKEYEKAINNLE